MSVSTPWGSSQQTTTLLKGFKTVSTASHGGMMVSRDAAMKHLSEPARKRALMHANGSYFCYEEDCDFLILLFDAKELRPELMKGFSFWEGKSEDEIEQYLIMQLSDYHSDYLIEVGVTPDPKKHAQSLLRKQNSIDRANHNPNVVVSARGDWATLLPGVFEVYTADDNLHYVTGDSYRAMREDPIKAISMPLDALDVCDPSSVPAMEDRLLPFVQALADKYMKQITAQHEDAIKEVEHGFYGPRAKFNGSLLTAKDTFVRHLHETKGISCESATRVFCVKLQAARQEIDPELRNAQVFLDNTIKPSSSCSP